MIRCSECKQFDKLEIKHKSFYYCAIMHTNGFDFKLWQKVPKEHPRWCPIYKGEKQSAK